jgi:hypothetical protein
MAAATEPKGDIISTYPKMVSSYVVIQLVSYVCSLLSTFGVRGATATAVAAHLAPVETTLCQMMFMTTMHNGPVSDGRLINVCRVGFLIDGIVLFVGSATVFRPESVADAVAAVNLTAIGGTPNNTSGLIGGIIWFIALGVIPGWLGVNMLTLIRRRLLERPGLGAFCDQATRAFLCLMVVQVVVSISTLVPLALATGVEAEIRGRKIVGCASNVNFMIPLLFGMKLAFFDTTGTTVAHWLTCGPTRRIPTSLNVGVSMVILHFLITVIPFVLLLGAASTTATVFAIHDLLAQGISTQPQCLRRSSAPPSCSGEAVSCLGSTWTPPSADAKRPRRRTRTGSALDVTRAACMRFANQKISMSVTLWRRRLLIGAKDSSTGAAKNRVGARDTHRRHARQKPDATEKCMAWRGVARRTSRLT